MKSVTFDPVEAQGLLPSDHALFTTGVPADVFDGVFVATPELGVVRKRVGTLLRFGTSGQYHEVCLDPSTGEVLLLLLYSDAPARPVNASLDAFLQCVHTAVELFPDHSAAEIADALCAIDPTAAERHGFWDTVLEGAGG
jgi:SUKH-4 immunity protein of toxin-antitoxin system